MLRVPRPTVSSASRLVLPYDPHDAASKPGTAELRVQTICVESCGDSLDRGGLGPSSIRSHPRRS
jgi:hypothetical protein